MINENLKITNRNKLFTIIFVLIVQKSKFIEGISDGSLLVVENPTFFSPDEENNVDFGFSLSVFFNDTHKNLLVGAPLSNTSQAGVSSPGALYSCDLREDSSSVSCVQLTVDKRDADDKYVPFIDQDLKDFQRLGASLSSSGSNILVCAPNWHYYERRITTTIDAPVGICFRSSSLEDFELFSVPYDVTQGNTVDYLNLGSCQSGFSTTISKGRKHVIGSPGCYNWEGEVFAETGRDFVYFGKEFSAATFGGPEGERLLLSNMYMGYSVSHGKFNEQEGVVAGIPRSAQTVIDREVLVMNPMTTIHIIEEKKLTLWATLTPPRTNQGFFESVWLFSYFGYSVAVVDVDGNGLDDVVVGAPFYHNATGFDQGAILVFTQHKLDGIDGSSSYDISLEQNANPRTGLLDYGRFGSAVANVGDLNGDGMDDLAVGAPYGSEGRVYIYLSSSKGLQQDAYQVICSSDDGLKDKMLRGFGASVGGVPSSKSFSQVDLAVGAHLSDTVVLFRSLVMIDVSWSVSFPEKLDLSSKCSVGKEEFPCARIVTCFSFSFLDNGKVGDRRPKKFSVDFDLDVNSSPRRLFFEDKQPTKTKKIFIEYQKMTCQNIAIYTSRQINNLDAFEIITSINHIPNKYGDESTLQTNQKTSSVDTLEIYFDCKASNASHCVTDLSLTATASKKVVFAEDAKFDILFEVKNVGESAYHNMLEIEMDRFLEISGKAELTEESTLFPIIDCRSVEEGKSRCSLGTFINTGDVIAFKISFVTTEPFLVLENLKYHDVKFEIKSSLATLSEIKNPNAAKSLNSVYIETNPEIYLTKSESSTDLVTVDAEKDYEYLDDASDEENVGPRVIHIYEIYNKMSYPIENNSIEVYWPYKVDDIELLDGDLVLTSEEEDCSVSYKVGFMDDGSKNISAFGEVIWKVTSCDVLYLEPRDSIYLKLELRLAMKTVIQDIYDPDFDEIRSYVALVSSPTLLGHKMKMMVSNDITTTINYGDFKFEKVPKTVYILGVVLGLALLLILLCCLRRFNFFKRKTTQNLSTENLEENDEEGEEEVVMEEAEVMVSTGPPIPEIVESYDNVHVTIENTEVRKREPDVKVN